MNNFLGLLYIMTIHLRLLLDCHFLLAELLLLQLYSEVGLCTRVYFFHRKYEMSRSEPRVDLGWAKGLTLQEVVSCTVQTPCSSSCRKSVKYCE